MLVAQAPLAFRQAGLGARIVVLRRLAPHVVGSALEGSWVVELVLVAEDGLRDAFADLGDNRFTGRTVASLSDWVEH